MLFENILVRVFYVDAVLVLESEQKRDQAKSFLQDFCWSKSIGYFHPENFCPGQMQAVWLGFPSFAESSFPSATVCTGGCPGGVRWRQAKFHCILKKLSDRFPISMIIEARFIVPLTDSPILHKILLLKTL